MREIQKQTTARSEFFQLLSTLILRDFHIGLQLLLQPREVPGQRGTVSYVAVPKPFYLGLILDGFQICYRRPNDSDIVLV